MIPSDPFLANLMKARQAMLAHLQANGFVPHPQAPQHGLLLPHVALAQPGPEQPYLGGAPTARPAPGGPFNPKVPYRIAGRQALGF